MSHFTVLAVARDEEHLMEIMLPYKQYGWGSDIPGEEKYVEFVLENKKEDFPKIIKETLEKFDQQLKKERELQSKRLAIITDGTAKGLFPAEIAKQIGALEPNDWRWKEPDEKWTQKLIVDKMSMMDEQIKKGEDEYAANKALFESGQLDKAMTELVGGVIDEETGDQGFLSNPNDKWDWYAIGGRWTGLLQLKNGAAGRNGHPGIMTEPNDDPSRADIARAGDVDWDAMQASRRQSKIEKYEAFQQLYQKYGDNVPKMNEGLSREEQELIMEQGLYFMTKDEHEALKLSREEYEKGISIEGLTYAFIDKNGEWHGTNTMGMFGMSLEDENHYGYDEDFWRFVDTLDPDDQVFVLDCHI